MRRIKRIAFWTGLILFGVVGSCAVVGHFLIGHSPTEDELKKSFSEHRDAFNELRDMLTADRKLRRVANWGVDRTDPNIIGEPGEAGFPVDRFNRYMELLKRIGGIGASRGEESNPSPCILMWAAGMGDRVHVSICWLDRPPETVIPTLNGFKGRSDYGRTKHTFVHLDSNWYIGTDR